MRAPVALVLAAGLAVLGCGHAAGESARLGAAAERAYAAGRYDEARARWHDAAAAAGTAHERDEARYREATCLTRAGRWAEAIQVLDRLLHDSPHGKGAPRALYDRALALSARGDDARGLAELDALLRAFPESAVAPLALKRYSEGLRETGEPSLRAYLDAVIPLLERTSLGERLHHAYAESLERSGNLEGARVRFLLMAERYPYPRGAFWDDALFRAADIEARQGDPAGAIRLLERMLSEREVSYVEGSYEKGRYAESQFRIAELYRDAMGDAVRARQAFERLWSAHRSSRLRDDAGWNAALLARAAGDQPGACRLLTELVTETPSSRYAPCAPRICPTLKAQAGSGDCHDYLVRDEHR